MFQGWHHHPPTQPTNNKNNRSSPTGKSWWLSTINWVAFFWVHLPFLGHPPKLGPQGKMPKIAEAAALPQGLPWPMAEASDIPVHALGAFCIHRATSIHTITHMISCTNMCNVNTDCIYIKLYIYTVHTCTQYCTHVYIYIYRYILIYNYSIYIYTSYTAITMTIHLCRHQLLLDWWPVDSGLGLGHCIARESVAAAKMWPWNLWMWPCLKIDTAIIYT